MFIDEKGSNLLAKYKNHAQKPSEIFQIKIMDWAGFEPTTPRMRTEYSTKLNYQPLVILSCLISPIKLSRFLVDLPMFYIGITLPKFILNTTSYGLN